MRARHIRMTTRAAVVLVASLLAAILAGCGEEASQGRDDTAPAGLTLDDLDGRVFGSGSVRAGDPLVEGTEVRLGFDGQELSAYAGCNHLFGTASLDGETLRASALGGTEMGCPQPLADQDAWLQEFLSDGPTLALDGGVLTLTGAETTLELSEEPAPDHTDRDPDDTVSDGDVASVG